MARKTILIADPGIDTAFALALALNDPALDDLGLIASSGNVGPEQATHNVRIILEQLDPPRLPRVGAALPTPATMDGSALHGPGGLGGASFPIAKRHEPATGDKVLVDLIREQPHEVTIVAMAPLTMIARAFDRDPELPALI